jgi:hypothetical protein
MKTQELSIQFQAIPSGPSQDGLKTIAVRSHGIQTKLPTYERDIICLFLEQRLYSYS